MAKTRTEKKDATRERLLRVGRRVFARRGYDATSIALVCREARVTHGALYHHFPSKEALFAAVLAEVFSEVADRVRSAIETQQGWSQVEAACKAYLDACTDREVQLFLFQDGPRVLPRQAFDSIDHSVNAPLVEGLIESWMARGLLEAGPVSFLARTLGAAFAEAGQLIREAEASEHARTHLGALLSTWIAALRRSSGTSARPVLTTERLLLEPWQPADEALLAELTAQPEISRFLFDGQPPGLSWVRQATLASSATFEQGGVGLWLARHGDGHVVGFAGFKAAEAAADELVVATAPGMMRRGYGREMAKAVLREANARQRTRIVATADATNLGSLKLLNGLGFLRVGRRTGRLGEIVEAVLPFRDDGPRPVA